MNKDNIVVGIAVLALVIGVWGFSSESGIGIPGKDGKNGRDGVGAVSTLDGVDNPYVSIGGASFYYQHSPFNATSSVLCSQKNPFSATSTILSFTAQANTGLETAEVGYLSTSTDRSATTTDTSLSFLAAIALAADAEYAVVYNPYASSTQAIANYLPTTRIDGTSNITIAPDEFLLWNMSTETAGTYSAYPTGACNALWQKVQ